MLDLAWRQGLLEHERDFHVPGGTYYPQHTGFRHDRHADPIAARFRAARARAAAHLGPGGWVGAGRAVGSVGSCSGRGVGACARVVGRVRWALGEWLEDTPKGPAYQPSGSPDDPVATDGAAAGSASGPVALVPWIRGNTETVEAFLDAPGVRLTRCWPLAGLEGVGLKSARAREWADRLAEEVAAMSASVPSWRRPRWSSGRRLGGRAGGAAAGLPGGAGHAEPAVRADHAAATVRPSAEATAPRR